jgi:hypothetical protein
MKKMILVFALAISIQAGSFAAIQQPNSSYSIPQEKQYKKIEVSQIPLQTLAAIKKKYGSYTISEAYKADDGEYKLVLTKEGINTTVTFTAEGELIKILN